MKKSKRYATRYTAKKRYVKDLQNLFDAKCKELAHWMAQLDKERAEARKLGITTIRIGEALPNFRGEILGISCQIRVDEFSYMMFRGSSDRAVAIRDYVRRYCMDISRQMEEGIMRHLAKEKA